MPSFARIGFLLSTLAVAVKATGDPLPASGTELGHFYVNNDQSAGCLSDEGKWTLHECGLFTVIGRGNDVGGVYDVDVSNSRGENCTLTDGDRHLFCGNWTPQGWRHWSASEFYAGNLLFTHLGGNYGFHTQDGKKPNDTEALDLYETNDKSTPTNTLGWFRQK